VCVCVYRAFFFVVKNKTNVLLQNTGTTNLELNMLWTKSFSSETFVRPESDEMRKQIPVEISEFTSWVRIFSLFFCISLSHT
jgi:hypothetical protein